MSADNQLTSLLSENSSLRASLTVAEADRERLDWIESNAEKIYCNPHKQGGFAISLAEQIIHETTLREAIDSAMTSKEVLEKKEP